MEMSKEQAEELQEKLKDMSPEELKEFQKQQCIFCHIISGKVASKKIYEDENCMAVLDINPANPGHILLLPKEHYSIMPQLNDKEIARLFMAAKHLAHALLRAFKAEGVNIFVANGIAAGQRAQHLMIHIIPRKKNDGLNFNIPQHEMSESDINVVNDVLTKAIAEKMGTAVGESPVEKKPPVKRPKTAEAEFEEKKEAVKEKTTEKKAENEVKEEPKKPAQYVKSQSSNIYHAANCPFAKRIKKKIYLTKEQAKDFKPCACATDAPTMESKEKKAKEEKQAKDKREVNLDDIAGLLGGR